jgi:hypothetical protein
MEINCDTSGRCTHACQFESVSDAPSSDGAGEIAAEVIGSCDTACERKPECFCGPTLTKEDRKLIAELRAWADWTKKNTHTWQWEAESVYLHVSQIRALCDLAERLSGEKRND